MTIWYRLALKEILNNFSFSIFFVLNLAIGLIGYVLLNSFSLSLNEHFHSNLREMMTADLMTSSSRPYRPEELETIDRVLGAQRRESRVDNFLTMVATPGYSRLVEVYAVDEAFPLYGRLELEKSDAAAFPQKMQGLQREGRVWMTHETALSLRIKLGDGVVLGRKQFVLDDYVRKDHINAITSIGIAPRIYIGLPQLESTGLLNFGSRLGYLRFFRFPLGTNVKELGKRLTDELERLHDNRSPIYLFGTERVNRNLSRVIGYFSSYMGLIGIIALFLAGIGAGYLFRNYFRKKRKEIAILMSLGASRIQTYVVLLMQIVLLGIVASAISLLLAGFLLPVIPQILKGIVPVELAVQMRWTVALRASVLGALGSSVFCLPTMINIHRLKPLTLLQNSESHQARQGREHLFWGLSFLPAIVLFWGMSILQTDSWYRGTLFLGGFLAVSLILSAAGIGFFRVCGLLANSKATYAKIAFRNLYRNKVSSFSCFLAIALGVFLINLIPQLQNGIQEEIHRPDGLVLPSFFLVDVQPEQLAPLNSFLQERSLKLAHASPIVRGRIDRINGEEFVGRKTKEENRRGFRRREFNFSYRKQLDISEQVIEGERLSRKPYDFKSGKPAEISIADSFAERYGLKIGDRIGFDVQGIPIEGRVVNIRRVRWTSFRPNFFILFQDGVLNDAPKTYLAAIPQFHQSKKRKLQNELVSEFPNISMFDIAELVEQILGIVGRISFALNFMAYLSIATGIMVVFSIARYEAQSRSREINLIKILGAGFKEVRRMIEIEFGFLGFMAAFFAILLSLVASYLVSILFFGRLWQLKWEISLFSLALVTVVCMVTALVGTESIIRRKPHTILQSE